MSFIENLKKVLDNYISYSLLSSLSAMISYDLLNNFGSWDMVETFVVKRPLKLIEFLLKNWYTKTLKVRKNYEIFPICRTDL